MQESAPLADVRLMKHCLDYMAVVGGTCTFPGHPSGPQHPLAIVSSLFLDALRVSSKE